MLSLVDLRKRFDDIVALDGASFDVAPGRIVGFLGPNGAGKTTAMRCILGLIDPDEGEVLWNGNPPTASERLRFGYMPEERGLYPKMKLREQLVYFARLSGLGKSEADRSAREWLDRLGLAARASSKLEELSHGNQQRIQLAASLVHGPELAVLDEPFSGLDPFGVDRMAELLRSEAASGMGVVFSSHQLDLVEEVCEDVVIIDAGRVVATGTLEALRQRSGLRHLEVAVDGEDWSPDIPGVETAISARGRRRYLIDEDTPLQALLARAEADGEVTRFALEPPSLSEVFREVVAR
jgi:ABC-2 type transport system ATP-binding protein